MPKPRVDTRCPANTYTRPHERIIEFSNGRVTQHKGGLVRFANDADGNLIVEVYRLDKGVIVRVSEERE
jgi:hypothetical protein